MAGGNRPYSPTPGGRPSRVERDRQQRTIAFAAAARRSMQEAVAAINAISQAAERPHRRLAALHAARAAAIIGKIA